MITTIQTAFPTCISDKCHQVVADQWFCIHDDPKTKKCYISADKDKYPHLFINNPYKRKLNFLAIDSCIFKTNAHKKCDCAVFDSSEFHFAELKSGASNITKAEKRKEAIEQLSQTIKEFKAAIDFSNYKISAHIAVGYFKASPSTQASDLPSLLYFKKQYKALLLEGNHITM